MGVDALALRCRFASRRVRVWVLCCDRSGGGQVTALGLKARDHAGLCGGAEAFDGVGD